MNSAHLAAHFAAETAANTSSQIVTRLAVKMTEEACMAASAEVLDSLQDLADANIRKVTFSAAQIAARMAVAEIVATTARVAAEAASNAISQMEKSGAIDAICNRAAEKVAALTAAKLQERTRSISRRASQELRVKMQRIRIETGRSAVEIAVRSTARTLSSAAAISLDASQSADEAADRIVEGGDLASNFSKELEREIAAMGG